VFGGELEVEEESDVAVVRVKIPPKALAKSQFQVNFLDGSPKVADSWYKF